VVDCEVEEEVLEVGETWYGICIAFIKVDVTVFVEVEVTVVVDVEVTVVVESDVNVVVKG